MNNFLKDKKLLKMKVGIIGAGNLGSALARLINKNSSNLITLSDKRENLQIFQDFPTTSIKNIIQKSNILFLCVKPTDMKSILNEIHDSKENICVFSHDAFERRAEKKIIVSCAAGISLNFIEEQLKFPHSVIRCMTNIPISIGKGAITYIKNSNTDSEALKNFHFLMQGPKILEVEEESLIDTSTILTGSMPAFTSFLAEEFIKFGCQNGLTYNQSKDLYISTIEGTMEILKTNSSKDIINAVSSPNGITTKGIEILEKSDIRSTLCSTLYKSLNEISSLSDKN